ncbi:MAG: hypothetical protein P1U56_02760 [Saprospiraceae bacterium]|nr:hypothetical protein [Saprospiraceae bacterium]
MKTTANPFANQVADYSDSRILQIATSPKQYAAKLAEACIAEANFRKLNLLDNSQNIKKDYHYIICKKIGLGTSIEDCKAYLIEEGHTEEEALQLLEKAARTVSLQREKETEVKKESSSFGFWTAFWVVLVIIRIILYAAKNG